MGILENILPQGWAIYPSALRASGYIAQPLWSILSNIPMPGPLYYHNISRILTANRNLWNHIEINYSFTNFYFVFKLIQMIRGSFESRSLILGQCIEFTKPGCRNCNFPSKDNHFANPLVVKRTQSRSLQRPKNYLYYHNYVKPTFPLCIVIYNH